MNENTYKKKLMCVVLSESTRWVLVNTFMCQIPIFIMILQGFDKDEILYSGLSYAVTLLIVANYTLEDLNWGGLKKTWVVLWLLVCVVFLALYGAIKIPSINTAIKENTLLIYIAFILTSNILAFLSSLAQLRNNASTILSNKLMRAKADAEKTQKSLEKIQIKVVLNEGDLP